MIRNYILRSSSGAVHSTYTHHKDHSSGLNLLLARIRSPYRSKANGIGINRQLTKAKRLVAQPVPRPSYICTANNGKANPARYLAKVFDEAAEAPYCAP